MRLRQLVLPKELWMGRDADRRGALQRLEERNAIVRDRVKAVADGRKTGLYLFGRAGIAKTTIVRETLDRIETRYNYLTGHSTALGLFDLIEKDPEGLFVLDDVGGCIFEKNFYTLMLAALGKSDADGKRVVRYGTGRKVRLVQFGGGIIFISNVLVSGHSPAVLEAFRQRIHVIDYDPADDEIVAQIWKLAEQPVSGLTKRERRRVAGYVIDACREVGVRPSLRHYVERGVEDFRDWKQGLTETDWKSLVRSGIAEDASSVKLSNGAGLTQDEEYELVVLEIWHRFHSFEDRLKAFRERTRCEKDTMYRAVRRLREQGKLAL